MADEFLDGDGLAFLIVDEVYSGQLDWDGLAIPQFELLLAVEPDFKLGNIREEHMADLVASKQQRKFRK